MRRWLRDFGFPVLVLGALAMSGYLAASVPVPDSVPDFALQAAAVYRLEVGAACFAAFYLAAMALMLAFDGRGFAEVGTRGLKATDVIQAANKQEVSLAERAEANRDLKERLNKTNDALNSAIEAMREQEERLEILEEER
jgi:hypothetical protein